MQTTKSIVQKLQERIWMWGGKGLFHAELAALRAEVHNLRYELVDEISSGIDVIPVPNVKSKEETLDLLLKSEHSLARFGDGEFSIALGEGIFYQEHSEELEKRLREVLVSADPRLLIGIPDLFGSLRDLKPSAKSFWRSYFTAYRDSLYELISFEKIYYDTQISRPYIIYERPTAMETYFENIKRLWKDRDVVLVEGERSKVGIGNDLFSQARSVRRIIGPSRHAFRRYDELLLEAKKQPQNVLFLLALGPTATVLAHDLARDSYRALDIGHIDLEYEWFSRKLTTKVIIPGKSLAEAGFKNRPDSQLEDDAFRNQVIARIC